MNDWTEMTLQTIQFTEEMKKYLPQTDSRLRSEKMKRKKMKKKKVIFVFVFFLFFHFLWCF
jgi:hypothetical protein